MGFYVAFNTAQILTLKMLSLNKNKLNKKIQFEKEKCLTIFHEQILESWQKVYCTNPENNTEMLNEYVLYNKEITVAKNTNL